MIQLSTRTVNVPLIALGIGLGLVTEYAKRPDTVVIAAVRDPAKAASIKAIFPGAGSKVIVVKIDSVFETDPAAAVASLAEQGISYLDVVIANAGIANHWGPGAATPAKELVDHFHVNVVGTVVLFQAVLPLLEKSANPKFVSVSTAVGSIAEQEIYPLPSTAYGGSKAALNYITRKLHFEHPNIVVYPISPGWVQTDMGTPAAKAFGMNDAPVTLVDCIAGVSKSVGSLMSPTISIQG